MPAKETIKKELAPKFKPQTGASKMTTAQQLALSGDYLAACAKSPAAAQIAPQFAALKTTRDAVLARNQELTDMRAAADNKEIDAVKAEADHQTAIENYAREAGNIAKGDATLLTSLGVKGAPTQHGPRVQGPADAPSNVRLLAGAESGSAIVKWTRPTRGAAFLAQYKLEPQAPGAAATDWLPAEGFATKNVVWTLDGLPPGAHLRARVRAIGAEIGPWSDEVLGKAR